MMYGVAILFAIAGAVWAKSEPRNIELMMPVERTVFDCR